MPTILTFPPKTRSPKRPAQPSHTTSKRCFKKPGDWVPYFSRAKSTHNDDKSRWEREKAEFIEAVKRGSSLPEEQELARSLEHITFDEFLATYLGAGAVGPGDLGGREAAFQIYIGHVGMVFLKDGSPWVVEAVEPRVQVISYDRWLQGRPNVNVWQGRLKDIDESQAARVVAEAQKQGGKPYKFWNFNLNDDTGFYCSKLVWLAVYCTLGLSLDDNNNPKRRIWYSPKQLIHSRHVNLLFDPGPYMRIVPVWV